MIISAESLGSRSNKVQVFLKEKLLKDVLWIDTVELTWCRFLITLENSVVTIQEPIPEGCAIIWKLT